MAISISSGIATQAAMVVPRPIARYANVMSMAGDMSDIAAMVLPSMMNRTSTTQVSRARRHGMRLAGIFGFLGVALGAFGAHALKERLGVDGAQIWRTAVLYHLVHAVLIAAAGRFPWVMRLAAAGIVLFSGSLYVLALSGIKILGVITPFGGLCFLAAWALLAWQGAKLHDT